MHLYFKKVNLSGYVKQHNTTFEKKCSIEIFHDKISNCKVLKYIKNKLYFFSEIKTFV